MYNKVMKKKTSINFCTRKSIAIIAVLLIVLATLPVASAVGVVTSCDIDGNEVDQFAPGERVYVKATGLGNNKDYKIWLQNDPVKEGYTLTTDNCTNCEGVDQGKSVKTVGTNFGATLIWSIPVDAQVTHRGYDIVVDKQKGSNVGVYDSKDDGLDAASVAGIVAPVPDVSSLILFASGLVLVSMYFVYGRRKKEEEKK